MMTDSSMRDAKTPREEAKPDVMQRAPEKTPFRAERIKPVRGGVPAWAGYGDPRDPNLAVKKAYGY